MGWIGGRGAEFLRLRDRRIKRKRTNRTITPAKVITTAMMIVVVILSELPPLKGAGRGDEDDFAGIAEGGKDVHEKNGVIYL